MGLEEKNLRSDSLKFEPKEENMISNKLLNPYIIEALNTLSEEGLVSLNPILEKLMNELIKVERKNVLGASRYERTGERKGYCNRFKNKTLVTRSGKLNLEVPF